MRAYLGYSPSRHHATMRENNQAAKQPNSHPLNAMHHSSPEKTKHKSLQAAHSRHLPSIPDPLPQSTKIEDTLAVHLAGNLPVLAHEHILLDAA